MTLSIARPTLRRTAIAAVVCVMFADAAHAEAPGTPITPQVRVAAGGTAPIIASNAAGDYVVTWLEPVPGQFGQGIVYARQFGADGVARGPAFPASSRAAQTNGHQSDPHVAMDDEGDFAVSWVEYQPIPIGSHIYVHRFAADGRPSRDDVRADFETISNLGPTTDIAMDRDGDFVVVWSAGSIFEVPNGYSSTSVAAATSIHARRFSANGAPAGPARLVENLFSTGLPLLRGIRYVVGPSVGIDSVGNFTIAWGRYRSYRLNGSNTTDQEIVARRYLASGVARGPIVAVSEGTDSAGFISLGTQIAGDANGGFVVTWNVGNEVKARSFDGTGTARSSTITVAPFFNQPPYTRETGGQVVSDAGGNFAVLTEAETDRQGRFSNVRFYTPLGQQRGEVVTVFDDGNSGRGQDIAIDAAGNLAICREVSTSSLSFPEIVSQRFAGR